MTDPVSLGVAGVAAAVALTAGWLSVPRPPALDPSRWFAATLATVLLGEEQAAGGDSQSWEARVLATVRFHPAVDDAVPWLATPITLPLQRGQAELIEALRHIADPAQRSERLFVTDPAAQEAVLSDPVGLGHAYDPARLLGPDASWSAIADWAEGQPSGVVPALQRALGAVWAVVGDDGDRPAVLDALVALGARRCFGDDLTAALEELAPHPSDRLLIAVAGDALPVLKALQASASLRDRVLAVVGVGASVHATDEPERTAREDWLGAHFTHAAMDLEAHRLLHVLSLQWLDPDDPEALHTMRFPPPGDSGIRDTVLAVHDLGPIDATSGPIASAVAKALWLVTGLLVLNGRSPG